MSIEKITIDQNALTANVEGRVGIDGIPTSADIVYVADLSGSTHELICETDQGWKSVLDCEKEGLVALNESLIPSESELTIRVGLIGFAGEYPSNPPNGGSANAVVKPGGTSTDTWTSPSTATDPLQGADIERVINSLQHYDGPGSYDYWGRIGEFRTYDVGYGTAFLPALEDAHSVLNNSSADIKQVYFLTDGKNRVNGDFNKVLQELKASDVNVYTFAIGKDSSCTEVSVGISLQRISDETSGTCKVVTNPADLKAVIGNIPSNEYDLNVTYDGSLIPPCTTSQTACVTLNVSTGSWKIDNLPIQSGGTVTATANPKNQAEIKAVVSADIAKLVLTITKTAPTPSSLHENDPADFAVTIGYATQCGQTKPACTASADIKFEDVVPTGLTLTGLIPDTGNPSTFTCNLSQAECDAQAVGDGNNLFEVKTTIDSGTAGQTLTNEAKASATITGPNNQKVELSATDNADITVVAKTATITIEKNTTGGNDTFGFESNIPQVPNFSITTANSMGSWTSDALNPGTYLVTEQQQDGWELVSIEGAGCSDSGPYGEVSIALDDTDITCTFTNNAITTISIEKSASSANVNVGETFEWTITVSNTGIHTARDVQVTDAWPEKLDVDSVVSSKGICVSGNPFVCDLGDLAPGNSEKITITGYFPEGTPGASFLNSATATSTNAQEVTANSTVVLNPSATLQINKVAEGDPATYFAGTNVTYQITVTNIGPDTAQDVQMTDTLDTTRVKYVNALQTGGGGDWTCGFEATSALVECEALTLAVNGTAELSVTVEILPTDPGGMVIPNTAIAKTTTFTPGQVPESGTSITVVPVAFLYTEKTPDNTTPLAGDTVTYSVVVGNLGPDPAQDVQMTDQLPPELLFLSISDVAGWTCTTPSPQTSGLITCTTQSVAANESVTFLVATQVAPGTPEGTQLTNAVTATTTTRDDNQDPDSIATVVVAGTPASPGNAITPQASEASALPFTGNGWITIVTLISLLVSGLGLLALVASRRRICT